MFPRPGSPGSVAIDIAPQKTHLYSDGMLLGDRRCPYPQAHHMILGFSIISLTIVEGGNSPFCSSRSTRPPAVLEGATRVAIDAPI